MNRLPKTSNLTSVVNIILISLFMGLLWLPTFDTIFHFDWLPSPTENRALASFPKFEPGWLRLQSFVTGLQSYFNDHFGCRKCLVYFYNNLQRKLFKVDTVNVLYGKNGWLFLSSSQMIDNYSGRLQLTPEDLHDWQVLLEKRRDWLARRGIAYLFVISPDKETIYPEDLPNWVTKIRPETKLDQFIKYMRDNSTVPILDLRNVLINAKKSGPVYLKTDTHWSDWGGFVTYQELMRRVAVEVPALKLEPLDFASFNLTNGLAPGGDLARMLGLNMTESNVCFLVPKPELPSFTTKQDLYDHPEFTINPQAKASIVLIHDSFALEWVGFLGYHFNRVTYHWKSDFNPAYIGQDKPAIVINEMVERFFDTEPPKKLMAQDVLN